MAHFAEIDDNNRVLRVIVVANSELLDEDGFENEAIGINFCKSLFGDSTNWVQTSYNGNFRKRFAVIGGTYDVEKDVFINEQPFPSWILDSKTDEWSAPEPKPAGNYYWSEESLSWVKIEEKA